jgi:DNA polymerase I
MYRVHDLETTTKTKHKRKASPFHPGNCVVLDAYKDRGCGPVVTYFGNDTQQHRYRFAPVPDHIKILVGMNYKFDLLWSWRHPELVKFFKRGGKIWDIQYAEYLLEGQTEASMMCSLDDLAAKYGGTLKPDVIKGFWNNGVETYDIPEDLLVDYGKGDLNNTEIVFIAQYRRARELGMLQALWNRFDGLLYTTECEFNGMHVDKALGLEKAAALSTEIQGLIAKLDTYLPPDIPPDLLERWKFTNRYHLSPLIFGGKVKYEKRVFLKDENGKQLYSQKDERQLVLSDGSTLREDLYELAKANGADPLPDPVVFSGGKNAGLRKTKLVKVDDLDKPKSRMEEFEHPFPGMTKPLPEWASATEGLYSVASDVIETLGSTTNIPFLKDLSALVSKQKDLGTYYITDDEKNPGQQKGMLTLVDEIDGCVHGSLNHNTTVTTRLSHNNPNLGNIPRGDTSEVKMMFTSRFGADGLVVEIDYSQLEVVVQAMLSGDENLIRDVNNAVDLHCKRVAAKEGCTYEEALYRCKTEAYEAYKEWKTKRTNAKSFSFQRAFGAGATAIALSTGMLLADVEKLIEAENIMYPGIEIFNADVARIVRESAKPTSLFERTPEGKPVQIMRGQYVGKTGARWTFRQWVAPDYLRKRGTLASFSPTEMKNYPVQGTAAELVQVVMGRTWRHFLMTDNYGGKALLINQVHDALYMDAHQSVYKQAARDMQTIMESADQIFLDDYNWDVKVKFRADAEAGPNLYNKTHINYDEAHA